MEGGCTNAITYPVPSVVSTPAPKLVVNVLGVAAWLIATTEKLEDPGLSRRMLKLVGSEELGADQEMVMGFVTSQV